MENYNYRGNSNYYQDKDSRANQKRGQSPYNPNGNYGGGQPSYRNNGKYRPRKNNFNNGGYHQDGYSNGYQNGYQGNQQGGNFRQQNPYRPNDYRQNDYRQNGGYPPQNGYNRGYNNPKNGRPNNFRGGKYTVDEKGYHHKKYWDHSDRKQQAYDAAAEREDDFIENDGKIRLNKYLSNSGMCSRREADRMIKAGMVQVNGETITEMGVKVNISDEVKYNGMVVKPEHKRYLLLNKPKDYITTLKDPHARNTVMELIQGACKERVYPVGRLDRNTTGILLFTNDGDLAKKLTHPSNEVQKIYHVTLDKNVTRADLDKISEGFDLEDGFINADEVGYIDEMKKSEVLIRIHSGRNRIVRRIFEALGYDVRKLDRIMFAGLDKKGLPRGRWRFLTDREIGFLNMISDKQDKEETSTTTTEI